MTLFVITGPPTAGKTTSVREHAKAGDITVDYGSIVDALTPRSDQLYDPPMHIVDAAQAVRNAAIHAATNSIWHRVGNVFIIDSRPNAEAHTRYKSLGATFIDLDPGYDVCRARAAQERPPRIQQVVHDWYHGALAQR